MKGGPLALLGLCVPLLLMMLGWSWWSRTRISHPDKPKAGHVQAISAGVARPVHHAVALPPPPAVAAASQASPLDSLDDWADRLQDHGGHIEEKDPYRDAARMLMERR